MRTYKSRFHGSATHINEQLTTISWVVHLLRKPKKMLGELSSYTTKI